MCAPAVSSYRQLEAFYEILSRQLPHFPAQFKFEPSSEDFRGRHCVFQRLDQFVEVLDSSAFSNLRMFFSWGEATSSGNRDAVCGSGDSFGMEVRVAWTSGGSSSHTSSHVATSFAPCLINVFGPQEFLLVTLPGTA